MYGGWGVLEAEKNYLHLTVTFSHLFFIVFFFLQSALGSVTSAALEATGLPFDPTKVKVLF